MATQLKKSVGIPKVFKTSNVTETVESVVDADDAETSKEISWIPCKSMNWAFVPKPLLPPKEEYDPVEKFVYDAIRSRSAKDRNCADPEQQKSAALGYKAILELLKKGNDTTMLKKVLLALRTSGDGTTMGMIVRNSKMHSNLLHLVFRLDIFSFENSQQTSIGGVNSVITSCDLSLADAYLNLTVALVSANSVFLTPALNMLWRCIQKTDAITTEDRQLILWHDKVKTKEEIEAMIDQQFQRNSRLHGALSKTLHLVPKGHSEIFTVIASDFPFKLAPLLKQACYVKHCFIVLNYVPTIRQNILEICIDKCLEIDVEIRIAQDGNVEIEASKDEDCGTATEGLFSTDEDLQEAKILTDKMKAKKEKAKIANSAAEQVDEMAEKLDTLMYLVFKHLITSTGLKSPRQMYKMIITAFNSVILTTHRSKFVQFVILFLCGLDYDSKDHEKKKDDEEVVQAADQSMLSREFAAKLIDLVLDPFRPSINRQSAACYLASFVSRSTSVCPGTACEAVSAILRFAEAYMDTYHTEALARNARRGAGMDFGTGNQTSKVAVHSLFYTACQSAFYIMCFRGRECIEYYQKAVEYYAHLDHENDDEDHILLYPDPKLIDISMQRWTRLVSHHLHPLMHCLESVRGEFLLLSDRFDLIEGSVLERLIIKDRKMASSPKGQMVKKANLIRTAATLEKRRMNGGVGGLGRGSNPLDSFFPFDPYLLRRSYSFVEPYYRHWTGSLYDESLKNESECEETSNLVDDEVSDDDISSDDSDDEEDDSDHSIEDTTECTAMSLTSTTCFIPENDDSSDSDSDITADDLAVKKETWMRELKRSRALSIEDCW